jgi:hypothetical protein
MTAKDRAYDIDRHCLLTRVSSLLGVCWKAVGRIIRRLSHMMPSKCGGQPAVLLGASSLKAMAMDRELMHILSSPKVGIFHYVGLPEISA